MANSTHILQKQSLDLEVDRSQVRISAMHRSGAKSPVVFLHGFGSTKEDYGDIGLHSRLDGHAVISYDAPGCGESHCDDLGVVDIPFLAKTAQAVLERFGAKKFHLVGHSMGGTTGLVLASWGSNSVLSFTNIEGNLAPEDCFLSRQIALSATANPEEFFNGFIDRLWEGRDYASKLYALSARRNVRPAAVRTLFESLVELSDQGDLLEKFLRLGCPTHFVYGETSGGLSYLPDLRAGDVRLSEIPASGHFPMYSNPPAMWNAIGGFIRDVERGLS